MTTQSVRSDVESVTVYTRGARVIRRAVLARSADAGEAYPESIAFTGLPLTLRDDSVKVSLTADGEGAAPTARDVRVTLDVPEPERGLLPVTPEELHAARLDEARAEARLSQLRRELARVRGLEILERPAGAEGEPPQASPTDARLALIEFRENEARELARTLEEAEKTKDDATRHRRELEERNRRATTARQAEEHELRKAVVVSLSGPEAAASSVAVEIEYQVPGARWAPAYALHLDRAMTRAKLSMRAVVAQRSGDDWDGVVLTLSTAEMQAFTELPELASVRIGRVQAEPPKAGWRPPPTGSDELYADWDRSFRKRFYDRSEPVPSAPPPPQPAYEPAPEPEMAKEVDVDAFGELAAHDLDDERGDGMPAIAGPAAAGYAPPPAAAAPMPVMAPQSRSMARKSAGLLGGLLGGRGGAPGAPPAPAPVSSGAVAKSLRLGAADALAEEAGPAGAPEVGADLLRYGDLRMPAPSDRRRGKLVMATRQEIYLQLLVAQEVSVSIDVMAAIQRAEARATSIADDRLPRGCKLAWSKHYDYAYRARARVDIPSDGSFHAVPLAEDDAETRRLYVVVPRESTDVFRTVTLDNPLGAPLLPGPVDVYLGGDFLLTSQVDFTAAGGGLELGLGVEQGIKVARNARYREETAGLIGGSLELHHQISLDVRNNLDEAVPLEVRERLPSVREDDEDDIRVTVGKVSPAWEPYEQVPASPGEPELEGGYRWRLEVPAGGAEALRADYEIKISSKHELVGGNRREA